MKMIAKLSSFAAAMMVAGVAFGQVTPVPDAHFHSEVVQAPMYGDAGMGGVVMGDVIHPGGSIYCDSCAEPLFKNVKVKGQRSIHPCAVKKIIRVNSPCPDAGCCGPQCVFIEVCAPPCDCEKDIRCRRDGDLLKYDYGKYGYDVKVRNGFIVVNYNCKGRPGR
ncbi:MAG: hypothetical protein ABJZ55_17110 [Fuerstiella sp.]